MKNYISRLISIKGTSNKIEFLIIKVITVLLTLLFLDPFLDLFYEVMYGWEVSIFKGLLFLALYIIIGWVDICVSIRRLHDIGFSGTIYFLVFLFNSIITFKGYIGIAIIIWAIITIYLLTVETKEGNNKYQTGKNTSSYGREIKKVIKYYTSKIKEYIGIKGKSNYSNKETEENNEGNETECWDVGKDATINITEDNEAKGDFLKFEEDQVQEINKVEENISMKFCSNCGIKLDDSDKFCFSCGQSTSRIKNS